MKVKLTKEKYKEYLKFEELTFFNGFLTSYLATKLSDFRCYPNCKNKYQKICSLVMLNGISDVQEITWSRLQVYK